MAQISQESKFVEAEDVDTKVTLPWWTWVLPFFIANLGTWISLWLKTEPGVSLWYLPTALGIVMVYWWGPRALLGVYINAMVSAPLWGLPWQRSFLYALPETLEVGLSWFLFIRIIQGKPWLPDLGNMGRFIFWGSLTPSFIADISLAWLHNFFGDITQNSVWDHWRALFSADLVAQFIFALPILILFTKSAHANGWTRNLRSVSREPFLLNHQRSPLNISFIVAILAIIPVLMLLFPIRDLWIFYGFLIFLLAIRYGVYMAIIGTSWMGILMFVLPILLTGKPNSSVTNLSDLITINLGTLLLSGAALFTGQAITDRSAEIRDRKRSETNLFARERYLSLLNDMTHTILLSTDIDSILHTLTKNMAKLIDADDCYVTRWDAVNKQTILVARSVDLDSPYSQSGPASERSMTQSVLEAGRPLVANDVFHSPYISPALAQRYPSMSILGVPLLVGGNKLGAVIIAFNTPHEFTEDEIVYAEHAGEQIALALWNYQQSTEIQQRLKEGDALTKIGRALSETERVGTDKVLQLIVDSARELIREAEESVIHLIDINEQALVPRAISGFEAGTKMFARPKMHMGEGVAGRVIRTGETISIGDIYNSPLFIIKGTRPTFKSLMVAPVQSGGQQIGTISVQSGELNAFSSSDVELLKSLGIQAAIALENTRLFEATQQRLREVDALYRISQGLAASLDPDELIEEIVTLLKQNFGYYHVQIFLLDPSSGDMVLQEASGEVGHQLLEQDFRLPSGFGIVGHVMETASPFVTNNVSEVVFFGRNPLLPDTQSELTVPISVNGEVAGVLDIQDKPPHRLTDSDLQLMSAVADQLAVALQKAELYTNLQISLHQEQTVRSQLIQSERLALVGRLLASVSHELNNPLQAIQNALFLLRDEISLSDQAKQDLEVILSESERMAVLIERLRTTYRPDRIRDIVPVDLNNLIEDVHVLITTHMRKKEITFEFVPDSSLPPVSGLSDQIRQVVLNLFLNAIEVMEPGGRLTVSTQRLLAQHEVLFTVKDTGPGIDPEILSKIFDAFITNKRTGTGLGLTITHDIIEQHNGRIEAENDPLGGAIFKIWLPVYEEEYE